MDSIAIPQAATWVIAAVATSGVILRPWGLPEGIWAVTGAVALVLLSLLPLHDALMAVAKGTDVYLFLAGMMLLAELARREGLFDWLAALAARQARGSASRLFILVYCVGIGVTALLSNDATAVVLTPAVYAVAKAANAKPLPYLFICAFIANAASFVLPISNPANLVLYDNHMPSLLPWLRQFGLPSVVAITATYAALRFTQRHELKGAIAKDVATPSLSAEGRYAAYGIGLTAIVLLLASASGVQLGAPTFASGAATVILVLLSNRKAPWPILKSISWGVLPLVAGLFVLVEGLNHTGVVNELSQLLRWASGHSPATTAWGAGVIVALASNLMNNLPVGLIAESAASPVHVHPSVTGALLIGVDLGPNLSVTGSLATILWLNALRREGEHVSARDFLRVGVIVMPPALLLSLAALIWVGPW
jgi:arsenical pump membrane protein